MAEEEEEEEQEEAVNAKKRQSKDALKEKKALNECKGLQCLAFFPLRIQSNQNMPWTHSLGLTIQKSTIVQSIIRCVIQPVPSQSPFEVLSVPDGCGGVGEAVF